MLPSIQLVGQQKFSLEPVLYEKWCGNNCRSQPEGLPVKMNDLSLLFVDGKSLKASVIYSNNEPNLTSCNNLSFILQ
jgi:hypothetical protein